MAALVVLTVLLRYKNSRTQDSPIITGTRLCTGRPRDLGSIPVRGNGLISDKSVKSFYEHSLNLNGVPGCVAVI
jgi:hypothetical protein